MKKSPLQLKKALMSLVAEFGDVTVENGIVTVTCPDGSVWDFTEPMMVKVGKIPKLNKWKDTELSVRGRSESAATYKAELAEKTRDLERAHAYIEKVPLKVKDWNKRPKLQLGRKTPERVVMFKHEADQLFVDHGEFVKAKNEVREKENELAKALATIDEFSDKLEATQAELTKTENELKSTKAAPDCTALMTIMPGQLELRVRYRDSRWIAEIVQLSRPQSSGYYTSMAEYHLGPLAQLLQPPITSSILLKAEGKDSHTAIWNVLHSAYHFRFRHPNEKLEEEKKET